MIGWNDPVLIPTSNISGYESLHIIDRVYGPGCDPFRYRIIFEGLGLSVSEKGFMSGGALLYASNAKCDLSNNKAIWYVNLHTGYWYKPTGVFIGHGWFSWQRMQDATVESLLNLPVAN